MVLKRYYSLFEKQNDKWVRISPYAYYKPQAIKVFQNELVAPFFSATPMNVRELRPVKVENETPLKEG